MTNTTHQERGQTAAEPHVNRGAREGEGRGKTIHHFEGRNHADEYGLEDHGDLFDGAPTEPVQLMNHRGSHFE